MRPGDIITASNGTTIEVKICAGWNGTEIPDWEGFPDAWKDTEERILASFLKVLNTDAEGRLTLADALVFAENLGDVDYIVDLATLTGEKKVFLFGFH